MAQGESPLKTIRPGEIYCDTEDPGNQHLWVVISREELNRGDYLVVVPLTSRRASERRGFANCVFFGAGEFGLDRNCVAQTEGMTNTDKCYLNLDAGPVGMLSEERLRELVKAVGFMMGAECEPCE